MPTDTQAKICLMGKMDWCIFNTSDLKYTTYADTPMTDEDGNILQRAYSLPPITARQFIREFTSIRLGEQKGPLRELFNSYLHEGRDRPELGWIGSRIGILLINFDMAMLQWLAREIQELRTQSIENELDLLQCCDAYRATWDAIKHYWSSVMKVSVVSRYILALEHYDPVATIWLTANNSAMCFKKKLMSVVLTTKLPPQTLENFDLYLDPLSWNPFEDKLPFYVDFPLSKILCA